MLRIADCIVSEHDLSQVLLAGFFCLFAAWTALNLLERVTATRGWSRVCWLVAAGTVAGCGVWATHFIAMLGQSSLLPMSYDPGLTVLSAVLAMLILGAGFALATGAFTRNARPVLGGAVVGSGVVVMHYVGIAALIVPARLSWQPDLVAVSVVLAVSLAPAGLTVLRRTEGVKGRLWAAALICAGVVGLHFAGMAALELHPDPSIPAPRAANGGPLVYAVSLVAGLVLLAGLVSARIDRSFAARSLDEARRLRALVEATSEGILVHRDGRVVDANEAMAALAGIEVAGLVGRPVAALFAKESAVTLRRCMAGADRTYGEGELLSAAGAIPVELTGRQIGHEGLMAGVVGVRDLRERRKAEARIRHLAHHDALTGLANRPLFHDRLEQALAWSRRTGEGGALICVDLDRFKDVNDALGHAAGDTLLCAVAERLQASLRETDTVARLGGDEFAIVQRGGDQPAAATALASRLNAALSAGFAIGGDHVVASASIGIAFYPGDSDDLTCLFRHADIALYRAKNEGGATHRVFETAMDEQLRQRQTVVADLRRALAEGDLRLAYMPLADAHTGTVTGFEALMRWHHPERGPIPPGEFIPLAEESGLIVALGEWALATACAEAARWPGHLRVSVNLSPVQFRHGDLVALVADTLLRTGLPAERLELEVTEGVLIREPERAVHTLKRLKTLGVSIALDDFGTGYSSLGYLQTFAFDKIKIDQSFVRRSHEPGSAAIIRAVIGLSKGLALPVVAEGVETESQRAGLASEGCDEVQGYLIGRPQPIESFAALLRAGSGPSAAAGGARLHGLVLED
ncbi:bifunctional diguanylate cyclase/phosphodiesterase [Marinivivus vitaminiproducens]|uniref:bifunctional diguanylate cyclase/phosphodiesterase n=1 Tax=Marinivivus vitaminiproducens TaxID=3035935 RepID=UPI0027A89F7F|nr:EAL domain-containing protein [Geminicoccaceae bacterium SCSIO 64248]